MKTQVKRPSIAGLLDINDVLNGPMYGLATQRSVSEFVKSILMRLATMASVLLCGSFVYGQNLTINGGTTFQTMSGVGTNINHNMWAGGNLKSALSAYVQKNGASLYRIVHECSDWVCPGCTLAQANAQIKLLHARDSSTLRSTYETSDMQDLWNTISYLNSLGVRGNQIMINPQGWTATWLGGDGGYSSNPHNRITAGLEPQFATMVASLMYYGKVVRGLDFNVIDPLNEPSNTDSREGPLVAQGQAITIYSSLITELNSFGLSGVVVQGPTICCQTPSIDGNNYSAAMNSNNVIASRVPSYTIHDYPSLGNPAGGPGNTYAGHDWWLTETNAQCQQGTGACDTGTCPSQGEWTWAKQTTDLLLAYVANGFTAVATWGGTNSYELQEQATPSLNCFYHMSYNASTGAFTPLKGFYATAILGNGIKPGMMRTSAATTLSNLTALSFYNSGTGKITVLGHNTSNAAQIISGHLANLPTVSTLQFNLTDSASNNFTSQAPVTVSNQNFSVTIPADSFFLLATPDPPVSINIMISSHAPSTYGGAAIFQ